VPQVTRSIRKCAAEALHAHVQQKGGRFSQAVIQTVDEISRSGGTPLVVADGPEVLGVIHLKDVVKGGIKERFAQSRKMGIRTVMITGDNLQTAAGKVRIPRTELGLDGTRIKWQDTSNSHEV
jgi:potassium-transporting ATPase ATP-binding subunit